MTDASDSEDAFVGAFGLVRTYLNDLPRYVMIRRDDYLDFVRAPRLDGETYKISLETAVADQLGLRLRKDYITSGVPRVHLNSRLCGSVVGADDETSKWYICEFYVVSLYGRRWQSALEQREDIAWLSPRDIVRGHGPDGCRLKPDLVELLKIGEVLPPDEVSPVE